MRNHRRGRSIVGLAMAFALVTAACGGDDDDAADEPATAEDTADDGDSEPAEDTGGDEPADDTGGEPADESGGDEPADDPAEAGGVLRVGYVTDVTTFDPFVLTFGHFPSIMAMYDALIRYDDDLNPLPSLATDWEISDDNTSVTVTLREGVTFHDGGPVDADAVVTTYERAMDPEVGSNMLGFSVDIESVTAVDPGTVLIELHRPLPDLAITDILQAISITDPAGIDDLPTRGSGSGPFKFESWDPGVKVVLTKNEDYWGTEGPYLDGIEYIVFGDDDALLAAYNSGAIDVAWDIPKKDAAELDSGSVLPGYPGSLTYAFQINANRPPFDNQNMRQMMQYATNRQGMLDAALFGQGETAVLPWAKSSPAYDDSFDETYAFDLDKAKELLDAAVAEGATPSAIINVPTSRPPMVLMAQILQSDLASIGFDLEINALDAAAFGELYVAKDYGIITNFNGNLAKYPTRMTGNSTFRLEDNRGWPDGLPEEYVAAVDAASSALTPEAQEAAFAELRDVMLELSWVINIAYNQAVNAVADNVEGLDVTVDTMLIMENVRLT